MPDPIIIIGAGQAGVSLAARLRALGYDGPLLMLGEEPVPPYQRPPLSKKYMSGELDLPRLLIRPESWYGEQDIELRLSAPVAALSPRERRVILADGSELRYAKLALTTGARPRRLPASVGGDLAGVFTIRNLADVEFPRAGAGPGQDNARGGRRLYRPRSRRSRRGQGVAGDPGRDGAAHPATGRLPTHRGLFPRIAWPPWRRHP